MPRCIETTKQGRQCKRKAYQLFSLVGLDFCSQHYSTTKDPRANKLKAWAKNRIKEDE